MGVPPKPPRLFHILILGTPFHLNPERSSFALRSRPGKFQVIGNHVMCLTITSKVFYTEVFDLDTLLTQATNVPNGEARLLKGSWFRPIVTIAPISRTDEATHNVFFRNWHDAPLEQIDELRIRGLGKTLNEDSLSVVIDASV